MTEQAKPSVDEAKEILEEATARALGEDMIWLLSDRELEQEMRTLVYVDSDFRAGMSQRRVAFICREYIRREQERGE